MKKIFKKHTALSTDTLTLITLYAVSAAWLVIFLFSRTPLRLSESG